MNEASSKYQGKIAACGMNCGLCIGHLRDRKPCGGCFVMEDPNKPKSCRSCSIVNCERLAKTESGFCYDCGIYPCARLRRLDQRYRSKYGMSMTENLEFIQKEGMKQFLQNEQDRWKCKTCGEGLSVHRDYCLHCKAERN